MRPRTFVAMSRPGVWPTDDAPSTEAMLHLAARHADDLIRPIEVYLSDETGDLCIVCDEDQRHAVHLLLARAATIAGQCAALAPYVRSGWNDD